MVIVRIILIVIYSSVHISTRFHTLRVVMTVVGVALRSGIVGIVMGLKVVLVVLMLMMGGLLV